MNVVAIFLLSVALAMDASAVAATLGMGVPELRARHIVRTAVLFGGFQAMMPFFGWHLGARLGPTFQAWDHWIAFALLAGIGLKMLWEARSPGDDETVLASNGDRFAFRQLVVLAIATSIDALAAGITLPMMNAPLAFSLAMIGVVTAVLSTIGLFLGRRFGRAFGKRPEAVGGVVLIGLGVKILVEHLTST